MIFMIAIIFIIPIIVDMDLQELENEVANDN